MPQPRLPLRTRLLIAALSFLPGTVLLLLSVLYFMAYCYVLFARPTLLFPCMLAGLLLGLCWHLYIELQDTIRTKVYRQIRNISKP
jgi:hypothetical protein